MIKVFDSMWIFREKETGVFEVKNTDYKHPRFAHWTPIKVEPGFKLIVIKKIIKKLIRSKDLTKKSKVCYNDFGKCGDKNE